MACRWDCNVNHAHRLDAEALQRRQGIEPYYFGIAREEADRIEAARRRVLFADLGLADDRE